MAVMNEAWAAIVAAAAAGVFGIGGTFAGLIVGRRQTTHQAAVEHGQWLRGQRINAYTALLPAWDQAVKDLQEFQLRWEDLLDEQDQMGEGYEPWFLVQRKADEVLGLLRPHLELCELLGPENVNKAAEGLYEAFRRLHGVMKDQTGGTPQVVWETWEAELGRAAVARHNFQLACIWGLRRTPSTEAEDSYG